MQNKKHKITKRILSIVALVALVLGNIGAVSSVYAADPVTVTIVKHIDGEMATAESANSSDFPMSATWAADNIGPGTGEYTLSENGAPEYQAMTIEMDNGADYSTNEILTGDIVAAECIGTTTPFALEGYTTGNSYAQALNDTPTMTIPAFTNMQNDKYVIVWNVDCATPPPTPTESVTVTISKFIQGNMATSGSAYNVDFPMSATWAADNIGPGTGEYTLSENGAPEYQAKTTEMDNGADYSTNEILTSDIVGANCTATTTQFALTGYTTGDTYAEAASSTPTMTIPAFTNMQNDKYVIVWNQDCEVSRGEIEGNVEGSNGTLAVTSIDSVDTTATADGTFTNGWRYVFHITAPSNEQDLAMKFSNWLRNGGGGTIPVASNMRISSAQADNGGATVLLIAADTYSSPTLHMTGDLSTTTVGRQVEVVVEVAIPNGTPDGSYSTNYGVQTNP